MKKFFSIIMMAAALTACTTNEFVKDSKEQPTNQELQVYTMTVNARMAGSDTKALSLNGNTLNVKWASTDQVSVFPDGWSIDPIGTLTAAASDDGSTTLSGTVTTTDISTGDKMQFLFPRATWDYTGQTGVLLAADDANNAIETKYDYALATPTITKNGDNITASANFVSQQAIVKFILKNSDGSADLPVSWFQVTENGFSSKLVQKRRTPFFLYLEVPWECDIVQSEVYDEVNLNLQFTIDKSYGTNGFEVVEGKYIYRFILDKDGTPSKLHITMRSASSTDYVEASDVVFENGGYYKKNESQVEKVSPSPIKDAPMLPVYGALRVSPGNPTNTITLALRNENENAVKYRIEAHDEDGNYYGCTSPEIKFENGKYYEVTIKMVEE